MSLESPGGPRKRRRAPDPDRPGTVYRSGPKIRRKGLSDGPPYLDAHTSVPQAYDGKSDEEFYGTRYDAYDGAPPPAGYDDPYGRPAPPQGPPPYAPPGPPRPPRRRRRFRARWVVLLLVLALIAYPFLLGMTAWTNLNRVAAIEPAHEASAPPETPGRTFLVVGSDSRDNLTAEERKRLGTGTVAGRRTDTIMLLHVPSGGGPTVLVSVPRDSYVSIPGKQKNKINAAYAFGGPPLLVRTIEANMGIRIDDYVETGLGGFANIVDAVGGIRICPKRDMNDKDAHINLKKGCQQADGTVALGYARARKSDPRGDLGRVERQREVLASIASKTLSPGTIAQPWKAFPAAKAGGGALTVDETTSTYAVVRFVLAMRAVSGGDGLSLTVPVGNANLSTSAGSSVGWDKAKSQQLFTALKEDDTEAIRALAAEQEKEAAARNR